MFHLFQTYVVFKCFMLQVFYVLEVCSESNGGTVSDGGMVRASGDEARRAEGLRTGRAEGRWKPKFGFSN
jgi:hypothetical protein